MYAIEPHITVSVLVGKSQTPVEMTVPWNMLRYLDTHAERRLAPDGAVIYRLPTEMRDGSRTDAEEKLAALAAV